jgi:hypothetical protein
MLACGTLSDTLFTTRFLYLKEKVRSIVSMANAVIKQGYYLNILKKTIFTSF